MRKEYFTHYDICFGVDSPKDNSLINTILLRAKKYIFSCNYWNKKISFPAFVLDLFHLEKLEKYIAFKRNAISLHKKKWDLLLTT